MHIRILVLMVLAVPAIADDVTTYELKAQVELSSVAIPSKWKCSAKAQVQVASRERDWAYNPYVGQTAFEVNLPRFEKAPHLEVNFKGSNRSLPQTQIRLEQKCSYSYTQMVMRQDSKGNLKPHYIRRTRHGSLTWECSPSIQPLKREGQEVSFRCGGPSVSGFHGDHTAVIKNAAGATASGGIIRHATQLKITHDLCNGVNLWNRKIIHLDQGIQGRGGEDDFEYTITLDGRKTLKIPSKDGKIQADIAYCGGDGKVKIEVSAVEKDLFFDDHYKVSKFATPTQLGDGDKPEFIRLIRKEGKYFGWVSAEVFDAAPARYGRQQRYAERPTH